MYVDAQQLFSDTQALVATAVSTNAIDFGADRDIGIGEPLAIVVVIKVSPTGGGTLQIDVQADTTSAFGAPVIVATTGAVAAAALTAGTRLVINIPDTKSTARWMRLNYTMVTMTAITLSAFLTRLNMVQAENLYKTGFLVD